MIRHLFLILFVIAGGIGASQLPNFARAYEQRLGGALGEVQKLVDAFATQAAAEGLTFNELAERHRQSSDSAVRGTADRMLALETRRKSLAAEMTVLSATTDSFGKVVTVATGSDRELLRDTLSTYEITATLDPMFGLGGVGFGWALYGLLGLVFRRRKRATPGGFVRR
ncbi:DUF2937 family protein [Zavarzinia compransoris]|uniref:DUF2937 domain-containing protein n=1 Tax=Zavarzinia compransoris TaxID=1264899 RepID=A0A317EBD9_9PROT|nr:DUF2937 family protein [Zavarzinia compransoris]PWR23574.1 hypothetical protein DKG75_03100 [Zavarzinia compransoris]TDP47787.1 DUF2937 family protein [Zavarzinia compransoris]